MEHDRGLVIHWLFFCVLASRASLSLNGQCFLSSPLGVGRLSARRKGGGVLIFSFWIHCVLDLLCVTIRYNDTFLLSRQVSGYKILSAPDLNKE